MCLASIIINLGGPVARTVNVYPKAYPYTSSPTDHSGLCHPSIKLRKSGLIEACFACHLAGEFCM